MKKMNVVSTMILNPPPVLRTGQRVEVIGDNYIVITDKEEMIFEGAVQTKIHINLDKINERVK